ncbi:hypothetical protein C8Q79DRAFT_556941 [Trametes meyenii]|nr:hypothetical protein C8Q79DRAFT_556941 [Trametes meyenii]
MLFSYAIFDFDLSLQLPRRTSLKDCRRRPKDSPASRLTLTRIRPNRTIARSHLMLVAWATYLSITSRQEAIPAVPSLALLFGKMTTHRIDDLWTAPEALAFVRDMEAGQPPATQKSCVTPKFDLDALDNPELYWRGSAPNSRRPGSAIWLHQYHGLHASCGVCSLSRPVML